MNASSIIEGSLVYVCDTNVLDEHGTPWTYGAGPFTVARIYRTPGYRTPWLRLSRVERRRGPIEELPGSFRPKELRPATARESAVAEAAFWATCEVAP